MLREQRNYADLAAEHLQMAEVVTPADLEHFMPPLMRVFEDNRG